MGQIEPFGGSVQGNTLTIDDLDTAVDEERLRWIREQLAEVIYKDGWTFTLDTDTYVSPAVVIAFQTDDSYNPGQPFTAETVYLVNDLPTDPVMFGWWLMTATALAEVHEATEVFMIGGKRLMDPHAGENRVWGVALYDAICAASRANQNPFFTVLHASVEAAVKAGTILPEPIMPDACINKTSHNVALKGTKPALPALVS